MNEAKHNLSRYKTAVTHCYNKYRIKHTNESFDLGKFDTYNMSTKHYFESIQKEENALKAKGLTKIGTGGDVFGEDFFH